MKAKQPDKLAEAQDGRQKAKELHKELYRAYNRYEHALSTGPRQTVKKRLNEIVELNSQLRRINIGQ